MSATPGRTCSATASCARSLKTTRWCRTWWTRAGSPPRRPGLTPNVRCSPGSSTAVTTSIWTCRSGRYAAAIATCCAQTACPGWCRRRRWRRRCDCRTRSRRSTGSWSWPCAGALRTTSPASWRTWSTAITSTVGISTAGTRWWPVRRRPTSRKANRRRRTVRPSGLPRPAAGTRRRAPPPRTPGLRARRAVKAVVTMQRRAVRAAGEVGGAGSRPAWWCSRSRSSAAAGPFATTCERSTSSAPTRAKSWSIAG